MKIQSIEHEFIPENNITITTVIINEVTSQCIMVRQIIDVLGKPGKDNDLEFIGTGDSWIISWTKPELTTEETRELLTQAFS